MMILNYTPHSITLDGRELPPSGLARCASTSEVVQIIEGIQIKRMKYGSVAGLPPEAEGIYYIVSRIVAEAVKGKRNDCLVVGDTIRNSNGQIVGCASLCVI